MKKIDAFLNYRHTPLILPLVAFAAAIVGLSVDGLYIPMGVVLVILLFIGILGFFRAGKQDD